MWQLDPFISAIMGAAATHLAFRKHYLKPDTLVVVSDHGLQPQTQCSAIADGWLAWIMHQEKVHIQCALNGTEKRVGPYKLDGCMGTEDGQFPLEMTYPRATGYIAFEFYGCMFHGHPECMPRNKKDPWGKSMAERYKKTK